MIVALHSVKAFFFIMAAHCTCKCICCGFGATRFVVDETTRAAAVAARVQKVALRRKEKLGWHKEGYAAQAAGFLRSTQKYVGRISSPTLPRQARVAPVVVFFIQTILTATKGGGFHFSFKYRHCLPV